MQKNKFLFCVIFVLINCFVITFSTFAIEAIQVPENDINLKIENLTRGSEVYVLLPETLLRYNMEKYINNNLNNSYQIEAEKAHDVQDFLNENDFVGYVNFYKEEGFNQEENNQIELRHYCFALGDSEVIGQIDYNNLKYVQIKINLGNENNFKIVLKDYLAEYNSTDIKFMIDEYGSKTYIDMPQTGYVQNLENQNIKECNINYSYMETNEYNSIEKATKITYIIIYIILIIIVIIIIILLIKRHLKKKKELEERKFWKKKLTKEEKKEEKKKQKEEKRKNRKNDKKTKK